MIEVIDMKKMLFIMNPFAGVKRANRHLADILLTFTQAGYEVITHMTLGRGDATAVAREKGKDVDLVVCCGGDGTLNRFLNDTNGMALPEKLYYFATGSGNDFLHDLGLEKGADPVPVAQYLRDLPTVTVNGKHWRFLNGIGYGIDGYCCEVGDALRGKSDKPVNYTAIAIKGLLFHFHPANAEVTVDGKTKRYRRVWLAPTMNGRFYGGGMMVTPDQHRGNAEGKVSVCVMHGSGKIKTLAVFPSIFKGGHVKHTEMVEILTGHDIEVRFDRPCALQIDGETIRNVTSYSVHAGVPARV